MTCEGYLLDTGVFIQAHQNYYGLDLVPGFWEALKHYENEGQLRSIDRARDEIKAGDALAEWIDGAPDGLFVSSADAAIAAKYAELMAWAQTIDFTDAARAEFASKADAWLVAYAAVHDLVLVTHESHQPDRRNRIKIPNACEAFGVEWKNTFAMLRELEVRFNWTVPGA
jgi:hypothetical protein